jgi:hypothetical protein
MVGAEDKLAQLDRRNSRTVVDLPTPTRRIDR